MADNDDFGSFFAGFVIGGLVGAALALLFAPQSGEETRTMIKEKSIELKDKAVATGQEARTRAEKALEEARLRADRAIQELQTRAEELAQVTRERAIEIQQRGQAVLEEQKARLGGKAAAKKPAEPEPPAPEAPAPAEST